MKNKLEHIMAAVLMITFLYLTNYVVGEDQSSAQDLAQLISGKERPTVQELTELFSVDFTFYGQVLDQDSRPVENASVSIEITYYDPTQEFFESDKTVDLVTDADGKFQLSDYGRLIFVKIEKDGYEYVDENKSFNLGSLLRPRHQPNESSPVTFNLYKKSYPAYLTGSGPSMQRALKSRFDVSNEFETKLYVIKKGYYDIYGTDGLMPDGQTHLGQYGFRSETKDIQISGNVPIANMYEIEFTPLVANSGLVLSDDRFEEAPESGYLSSVTISIPTDNRADFKKYIYAKTADGSFYSRLDIEIMIGGRGRGQLIITSWTNPAGSRNLKYDQEYQDYEDAWRIRLYHLREAAKLYGVVQRRYLDQNNLENVIGTKPDGTFDEILFQQEADALKAQLKVEDPRWWHALEE